MVQGYNVKNDNIFSLFPEYRLEQAEYYNKKGNLQSKPDEVNIEKSPEKKSGKKAKVILGSTLATTIITAGILGGLFGRGLHGSSMKKFSKIAERLSAELQHSNAQTKDITTKTVYYTKKGAKKTIDTMQATSNFTAMKDWICDKIFRMNKYTTKFADSTKSFFKGVVDKTLGKKYDKVGVKVKDLTSLLKHCSIDDLNSIDPSEKMRKITIKGKTLTLGEWIEKLSDETIRLEGVFDESFSLGARRSRGVKRSNLLKDLPQKVGARFFKNKQGFFNPENYKTYATEDLSKAAHDELRSEILSARKQVTNTITSIYDDILSSFNGFSQKVRPEDDVMRKTTQELRKQLLAFKNCTGKNEVKTREKLAKEISSQIENMIKSVKGNEVYSAKEQEAMLEYLSAMKEGIINGTSSKGSLEEIMTIITGLNRVKNNTTGQKVISDRTYKEFSKLSSKISKGLEKATEMEMDEYFLKQAELEVGSATTDVLSVFVPIGVGAYSIAKGDDKDEKISATLTTCIPLVGTFATFVYGTSKMFSGAKNLGFSLLTGIAMNRLGCYCDKLYKKYKSSGSVVDVVKGEYDNLITGITPAVFEPEVNQNK